MKYAGIDWASTQHVISLIDEQGARLAEWSIVHSAQAITELLARFEREGGAAEIAVAIESGAPLVVDQLLEAGYRLYPINPKQSDRYRDRHTAAGSKDDRLDAFVLADALRTDHARLRVLEPDSERTEEIRLRDRSRSRLIALRTALSNQLRAVLARYFPVLLELHRAMDDSFLLALLQACPDAETARAAREARLRRLLEQHSVRKLQSATLLELFKKPSFLVRASTRSACRDEALSLAKQIELLNAEIRVADKRIEELLESHPDHELLLSLPGLGTCLVARVIAGLGDHRAPGPDPRSLLALAGTAPVTRRSGKSGAHNVSMRHGCSRELQCAFYLMARCSLRTSRWAAEYLRGTTQRGVRRPIALRALSNKWAKILWAVLHTRRPYDEALHISHLLANKVPWAATLSTPATDVA